MLNIDWSILENPEKKWHDERKQSIGSSDIPIILGLSPYKTPRDLWLLKTGQKEPDEQNFAQRRGIEIEPIAREWVNKMSGKIFIPQRFVHKINPRFTANLDGYCVETNEVIEIKFSGQKDHATAKSGIIPPHYLPQVEWQYIVSECTKLYYVSFQENDSVVIEVPKPNEERVKYLTYVASSFLELIDHKIEPVLHENDLVIITDDEMLELANRYVMFDRHCRHATQELKLAREKILAYTNSLEHKRFAIGALKINGNRITINNA